MPTVELPVIKGPVKHLLSQVAGARPGDGTVRALLSGELFINSADHVVCTLGADGQLVTINQLDRYRLVKAINAHPLIAAAGGYDAILTFAAAGSSPGSTTIAATTAAYAPPGGDVETLILLPWMVASTTAEPPGAGLSAADAAALVAVLRTSAQSQGF